MLPTSALDHLPCPANNCMHIYSIFIYSTTQCGDIQELYHSERWQKTKKGARAGKTGFKGRKFLKIVTTSLPACLFARFVPIPTLGALGKGGNREQRNASLFLGPLSFTHLGKCQGQREGSSTTVNSSFLFTVNSPWQKTLHALTIKKKSTQDNGYVNLLW